MLHVGFRAARVYDQSENKEIGGRGAKLGGGAKTFGGGGRGPPRPPRWLRAWRGSMQE